MAFEIKSLPPLSRVEPNFLQALLVLIHGASAGEDTRKVEIPHFYDRHPHSWEKEKGQVKE